MELSLELFISAAALVVSIYTFYQTKKHEQISRVPHLDWNQARQNYKDGMVIKMSLRNTGLGPAIIEDLWFLLDEKKFSPKTGQPIVELAEICLAGFPYRLQRHGKPGIGSLFPVGEAMCIVELHFPRLTKDQEEALTEQMKRAEFEVNYRSVHGQRFRFTTKDKESAAGA